MSNAETPIIFKKVVKGGHGHHGGAWKVAYADFVTAMMAFVPLLWLLNATTEEQRRGIADHFTPATVSKSTSGAGGILGEPAVSSPGAMTSRTGTPSVSLKLRPASGASAADSPVDSGGGRAKAAADLSREYLEAELARREQETFDKAEAEIRPAIQETPDLQELEKHLVIDQTPEGLRIQIVDQEGRPMFASGGARMLERTRALLRKISSVVEMLPNSSPASSCVSSPCS